jgi:hypothetical protein
MIKLKDILIEKSVNYKEKDWKKYNSMVKRNKLVAFQTSYGRQFTWSDDTDDEVVIGIDQDGGDHEFNHDEVDTILIF